MSKRSRAPQLYKIKRTIELPLELWQMIMGWVDARSDTSTVLTFALVCKGGRAAVAPSITRWVADLDATWKRLNGIKGSNGVKGVVIPHTDESIHKQLITLEAYCRYWGIALNLPRPAIVTTPRTEEDIHFALYYTHHIAALERDWRVDKPDGDTSLPFHTRLHLTGIQLRDAFYYDAVEKVHKPLKKKPGLQTVEMKTTRAELLALAHQHIQQRLKTDSEPTHDTIASLARDGLDQIKDMEKLRVTAYNLLKKDLVTHKPHSHTPLRDAVLDGYHLYDSENHAARTLYHSICVFRRRNLSRNQQLKVLRLAKGRDQRARAITLRMGAAPKGTQAIGKKTTMVIDDSDEYSDSDDDSDIDGYEHHEVYTHGDPDEWDIVFAPPSQ